MFVDTFGHATADTWRLLVSGDGIVGDRVYTLADLQAFTARSHQRWRGVPLSTLLAHAGLRPDAAEVVAVGRGDDHGWSRIRRALPVAKALGDALVAWELGGRPFPDTDGYPARLVIPGWAGVTAVTRLSELRVTTRADRTPGGTPGRPVLAVPSTTGQRDPYASPSWGGLQTTVSEGV